jgi:hypothetical protein
MAPAPSGGGLGRGNIFRLPPPNLPPPGEGINAWRKIGAIRNIKSDRGPGLFPGPFALAGCQAVENR